MRTIKFRAWDGNEMQYDVLAGHPNNVCDYDKEDVWFWHEPPKAIMQFTGLHDKNGREIWEGDIVKNFSENSFLSGSHQPLCDYIGEIVWRDQSFQIKCLRGYKWAGGTFSPLISGIDSQVLGNVYESPEIM